MCVLGWGVSRADTPPPLSEFRVLRSTKQHQKPNAHTHSLCNEIININIIFDRISGMFL